MSGQPGVGEDELPFLVPMTQAEFVRQAQEQQARAQMESQDRRNRVNALLLDELTTDQLSTLNDLLHGISHNPVKLVNFWEGRVSGILAERFRLGTSQAHAFVDDPVDLDNPYCAWVDAHGTRCNLPPANGRHQAGQQ